MATIAAIMTRAAPQQRDNGMCPLWACSPRPVVATSAENRKITVHCHPDLRLTQLTDALT